MSPVPTPRLQLVNWEKLAVASGSPITLTLTITPEDNAVLREGDFVPVIEPGVRAVWLGGSSSAQGPGAAAEFRVDGPTTPLAQCGQGGRLRAAGDGAGPAHVWPRPQLSEFWGGATRLRPKMPAVSTK